MADLSDYSTDQLIAMRAQMSGTASPSRSPLAGYSTDQLMAMRSQMVPAASTPSTMDVLRSATPEDYARAIGGSTGVALQGLTLGLGDEIVGGGNAALDYLAGKITGQPVAFSDAYGARKQQFQELVGQAQEAAPAATAALELGSSMAIPVGAIAKAIKIPGAATKAGSAISQAADKGSKLAKAATVLGKAGASGAAGAIQGGVYGFNTGEGSFAKRLESAKEAGTTGAAFGAGLSVVGQGLQAGAAKLKDVASRLERSGIGYTAADYKKAIKGPGALQFKKTGENPLTAAYERVRPQKLIKPGDPVASVQNLDDAIASTSDELQGVLSNADDYLRGKVRIKPNYENARRYVEKMKGPDKVAAKAELQQLIDGFEQDLDGTLGSLQEAKRYLYSKKYSRDNLGKMDLEMAVAQDFKETIEKGVDILADSGVFDAESAGIVKRLNSDIADYSKVKKPLIDRVIGQEEAANPSKSLLQALRTSGGVGQTLIAGTLAGGAATGASGDLETGLTAAGLAALATSPSGRAKIGSLTRKAGAVSELAGRGAEAISKSPALVEALGMAEGQPDKTNLDIIKQGMQRKAVTTKEGEGVMIGKDALELIKRHEGKRLKAYGDPVGIQTIGYGHTGEGVQKGRITEAEAEALLQQDAEEAERALDQYITVPLTQKQRDALTSFIFNVGAGAFARSTLADKINSGDFEGAASQFGRWIYGTKDGKKVKLPGLVKRREEEAQLFRSGIDKGIMA